MVSSRSSRSATRSKSRSPRRGDSPEPGRRWTICQNASALAQLLNGLVKCLFWSPGAAKRPSKRLASTVAKAPAARRGQEDGGAAKMTTTRPEGRREVCDPSHVIVHMSPLLVVHKQGPSRRPKDGCHVRNIRGVDPDPDLVPVLDLARALEAQAGSTKARGFVCMWPIWNPGRTRET